MTKSHENIRDKRILNKTIKRELKIIQTFII